MVDCSTPLVARITDPALCQNHCGHLAARITDPALRENQSGPLAAHLTYPALRQSRWFFGSTCV